MPLDSLKILEIGDVPFFRSVRPAQVTYYYVGKKSPEPKEYLTYARFRQLRTELAAGQYDLLIFSTFGVSGAPWRPDRSLFSNLSRYARCLFGRFHAFGAGIVPWLLRDSAVPLLVLDRKDDPNTIPAHYLPLLEKSRVYFWRELPVKLEHGFFSTGYLGDTSAVRKSALFRDHRHKIEPISLGVDRDSAFDAVNVDAPKTVDIFFAGSLKGSAVRESGARLIRELAAEGIRVEIEESRKYSRPEFLQRCAESWLVWSPEGHGWDCYRHYEVGLAGSVPVMNYPRTRRHQPLIDGVHGFYYGVEGDDLKRVIRLALADKAKLTAMAKAGRAHVLAHHTYPQLVSHMLAHLFPG